MASAALDLLNTSTQEFTPSPMMGYDLTVVDHLVARALVATRDQDSQPTVLHIGATSDLVAQTYADMRFHTMPTRPLRFFETDEDGVPVKEYMRVAAGPTHTTLSSSTNALALSCPSKCNEIRLGDATYRESAVASILETTRDTLLLRDDTYVDGDLTIGRNVLGAGWAVNQMRVLGSTKVDEHVVVGGNLFSCNLNVVREFPGAATNRVGFGMQINENMQLEVVRHVRFTDATDPSGHKVVTRKVAVFGGTSLDPTDSDNASYAGFGELEGASVSNVAGTLSNYMGGQHLWPLNSNGHIFFTKGYVGIATSNPTCALDVGGEVNALNMSVEQTITTTDVVTTSDIRTKADVSPVDPQACFDMIMQLDSIRYRPLAVQDSSVRKFGFSAQDVESSIPDIVRVGSNAALGLHDCKYVDMNSVIPLLVGSVRHLAARLL